MRRLNERSHESLVEWFEVANAHAWIQEVVSLGASLQCSANELQEQTAQHLDPVHWHEALLDFQSGKVNKPAVLLDARNIYETRIGHFKAVRNPFQCTFVVSKESLNATQLLRITVVFGLLRAGLRQEPNLWQQVQQAIKVAKLLLLASRCSFTALCYS